MTIKVGDKLPSGTLYEFIEDETPGCTVGPNAFKSRSSWQGKRVGDLRVARRVYPHLLRQARPRAIVQNLDKLKAAGHRRDLVHLRERRLRHGRLGPRPEGQGQGAHDGRRQRHYTKALGLELDLSPARHGCALQRFSMLVVDGG